MRSGSRGGLAIRPPRRLTPNPACATGPGRSAPGGKRFGRTGGKVGFLAACPALTHALARTHQFLTFTTPPNLQAAVAWGLENAGDWFRDMPRGLEASRDRLSDGLRREGFAVLASQGTYFLNIDLAA